MQAISVAQWNVRLISVSCYQQGNQIDSVLDAAARARVLDVPREAIANFTKRLARETRQQSR